MAVVCNLAGQKFDRLLARRWIPGRHENGRKIHGKWECDCDCGGVAYVVTAALVNHIQKGCGCVASENCRALGLAQSHPAAVIAAAVADYAGGMSGKKVGAKHGIDSSIVYDWARKHGVPVREKRSPRTYALNEGAFATLTDESAYWLGFLLADGNNSDAISKRGENGQVWRRAVVQVTLKESDRGQLESLARFLGSNRPLQGQWGTSPTGRRGRYVSLSVNSRKLCEDVARFGVTPRKTFTADVHPALADNPHFWRGCIDGDGSVLWCRPRRRHAIVQLVGTRAVCEAFARFVEPRIGRRPIVSPQVNIWMIRFAGRKAGEFAAALYAKGPSLARKRATAMEFAEEYRDRPVRVEFDWTRFTRGDLEGMFGRLGSWARVGAELGVGHGATIQAANRLGVRVRQTHIGRIHYASRGQAKKYTATIGGTTKSVSEWCRERGVKYGTVARRIRSGATPEEAITRPAFERPGVARLAELFAAHGTWRQVASAIGVHEDSIRKWRKHLR